MSEHAAHAGPMAISLAKKMRQSKNPSIQVSCAQLIDNQPKPPSAVIDTPTTTSRVATAPAGARMRRGGTARRRSTKAARTDL